MAIWIDSDVIGSDSLGSDAELAGDVEHPRIGEHPLHRDRQDAARQQCGSVARAYVGAWVRRYVHGLRSFVSCPALRACACMRAYVALDNSFGKTHEYALSNAFWAAVIHS